ncbi:MAG: enolase C-terminal domain-like protein [Granulosicoccus sp.]
MIVRIKVHTHCNDLGGKVWNPAITWRKKYAVFITIENSNGITGLGECWCFDSAPDALVGYLRTEVCPQLIGTSIHESEAIYKRLLSRAVLTARHGILASAWSGIDIALWDMRSREAKAPLWKLLESHSSDSPDSNGAIYLYASGGLYGENKSTDNLVSEMTSMHVSGFDIVKMKIGGLRIEDDVARVNAVLNGLDQSCKLIVDGVYSYTCSQALTVFKALPADRIEAFQSPLRAENIAGMKSLCDAGVPVMATEAEYRSEIHQQLLDTGAVRFLQTAAIACGGINRLFQLSRQTEQNARLSRRAVRLSLEVSSTAVALLAAAHYAAASQSIAHVEYHHLHQVFFDRLKLTPIRNRKGWFQLPEAHGLGIELPQADTQLVFECA